MEFGAVTLIAVLFVISRLLKQFGGGMTTGTTLPPRAPDGAPQTMSELWQEMQRQLETAQGRGMANRLPPSPTTLPTGSVERVRTSRAGSRSTPKRLPSGTPERGGSIEVASRDETIVVVDHDDAAEGVARRRITSAAARDGALQASDHARFDRKIREAATPPAPARDRSALQRAMIWREVLGPPVTLRQDELL